MGFLSDIVGKITGSTAANKTATAAANAQLDANEQASLEMREAAEKASGMLDPLAAQFKGQYGQVNQGNDQMQAQLGQGMQGLNDIANQGSIQRTQANISDQSGDLNVGQFLDPSMQFQQEEGMRALNSSAAARGGANSGAAMREAMKYGAGLASQSYNTAVGQAMSNRDQQLNVNAQNQSNANDADTFNMNQRNMDLGLANNQIGVGQAGLAGNTGLMNTGIGAIGNQASITSQQGQDQAAMTQNAGAIQANGIASQQSTMGGLMNFAGRVTDIGSKAAEAYAQFSDEDLKTGIEALTDDEIDAFLSQLEPSEYSYTDEAKDKGAPSGRTSGIMAQDLEKSTIGKQLVIEDEDGHKKVDIGKAVGTLLAATASTNKRLKKIEGKK